jgi:hypothetical protein
VPTIKNVGLRVDELHDGRPFPRLETRDVTDEQLALPHYQSRIAEGRIVVAPDPPKRHRRAKPDPQEDDQ